MAIIFKIRRHNNTPMSKYQYCVFDTQIFPKFFTFAS
jgi:hypothetical protein